MVKLKKIIWFVSLVTCFSFSSIAIGYAGQQCSDRDEIFEFLGSIPAMTVNELTNDPYIPDGHCGFKLSFDQPLDHQNPAGQRFTQTMVLSHRSRTAPLVMRTLGYYLRYSPSELTVLLNGNQLSIEHRFFNESMPDPVIWDFLTIKQAAADHHRIVKAIRPYYTGAWLSTGISKGGMTASYHRRFYPDDVNGTISYVAPLSFSRKDERYDYFLEQVGDPACRDKLVDFQIEALNRRSAMEKRMKLLGTYNRWPGGVAQAFDYIISEFYYAFWQYQPPSRCNYIPPVTADDNTLYAFIEDIVGVASWEDSRMSIFEPYYYQAYRQLGYPLLYTRPIDHLLQYDPNDYLPYIPQQIAPPEPFEQAAMLDIYNWVSRDARRFMSLYGTFDPWTAGAYPTGHESESREVYRFMAPEGNHRISILDLTEDERNKALQVLANWTGVEPDPEALEIALRKDRTLDVYKRDERLWLLEQLEQRQRRKAIP
ncbi:MAG: peptidase [Desulfobacteraceae bacterium]|nr:peptidase [Desulfobacteraceae bacterium]